MRLNSVVFPAPFGPMMTMRLSSRVTEKVDVPQDSDGAKVLGEVLNPQLFHASNFLRRFRMKTGDPSAKKEYHKNENDPFDSEPVHGIAADPVS